MASEVDIYNRALSSIGAARVSSTTEKTRNARACTGAYAIVRDALLREYRWAFAVKRASLPALAGAPVHGPEYAFQLPADYLRLLPPDSESTPGIDDRAIEGQTIVSDSAGPLEIIYIAKITQTANYNASFVKALAADLAVAVAREVTGSTQVKESVKEDRDSAIREARRTGAIERRPQIPREDPWLKARW